MFDRRGLARFVAVLCVLLAGVAGRAEEEGPRAEVVSAIESALPAAWHAARVEQGRIPWGHHWGERYDGPRGTLLVLVGPADVLLSWSDTDGIWRREPIAKESLLIWIMPAGYRNNFWSFLDVHRPVQPDLLLEAKSFRVYVRASHELTAPARLRELSGTYATAWPDSPHETGVVSWKTWKQDLTLALGQLEHR